MIEPRQLDAYRKKARSRPAPLCYYDWLHETEGLRKWLGEAHLYLEQYDMNWLERQCAALAFRLEYLEEVGNTCICTNKTGCTERERRNKLRRQRIKERQVRRARLGNISAVR